MKPVYLLAACLCPVSHPPQVSNPQSVPLSSPLVRNKKQPVMRMPRWIINGIYAGVRVGMVTRPSAESSRYSEGRSSFCKHSEATLQKKKYN